MNESMGRHPGLHRFRRTDVSQKEATQSQQSRSITQRKVKVTLAPPPWTGEKKIRKGDHHA